MKEREVNFIEINSSDFGSHYISKPRSFRDLNALDLLTSVYRYGEGRDQKNNAEELATTSGGMKVEAEVLQQCHDYALLRVNPTFWVQTPSVWLAGYSDRGLFLHSMPYGDIDYESESFWHILEYLNRHDEGFHRVQGDLLIRKLAPWEAEDIKTLSDEDEHYFSKNGIALGNNHRVYGESSSISNDEQNGDRAIVRTKKRERTRIDHGSHPSIEYSSNTEDLKEIGMQRRDPKINGGVPD